MYGDRELAGRNPWRCSTCMRPGRCGPSNTTRLSIRKQWTVSTSVCSAACAAARARKREEETRGLGMTVALRRWYTAKPDGTCQSCSYKLYGTTKSGLRVHHPVLVTLHSPASYLCKPL